MKIAVWSHMSLAITAFTMSVTQLCANDELYGGWSDSSNRGVTHVTAGQRVRLDVLHDRDRPGCTCAFTDRSWNTSWMPLYAFQK